MDDVAAGGVFITFSGPVPAIEAAFSTSLHTFSHDNAARYAPFSDPAVPSAIASVVQSVSGLAEVYAKPHTVFPAQRTSRSSLYPDATAGSVAAPDYTLVGSTTGTIYHFLSPGDFSLIYDVNPVLNAGITGAGSRVAILGGSRVQPADVTAYETLYSLPSQQPTVVVLPTGTDPGYTADGNEGEAILDVDRVLATAPSAGPDLLVAKNALAFTTTFSLLQYNISTLNDPIQSLSFGACEYSSSSRTYAQQFDSYFATAAAQGIGTFISLRRRGCGRLRLQHQHPFRSGAGAETCFAPARLPPASAARSLRTSPIHRPTGRARTPPRRFPRSATSPRVRGTSPSPQTPQARRRTRP